MIKGDLYNMTAYLYGMKKTKHIIVRITESQFKHLADALITEQRNKSTIIRDALDNYLDRKIDKQAPKNNKNKKSL